MFKNSLQILSVSILFILWQSCAQMAPLTGGARDTKPPKLVSAIPENLQTKFKSELIVLKFDEFVQLKDLKSQLVISPKLKSIPEIHADGKKVKIQLDTNELQPNTTYRFYFGLAIADMHEGNPLRNFEYIFSTGSFIDTLKISGIVRDAASNRPIVNALVGLYSQSLQNDSTPYLFTPNYVTKSDEKGEFLIQHLPAQTFRVYSIDDVNNNLLYDRDAERIGFLNSNLQLSKDSSLSFRLFKEEPTKVFIKKTISPYYGHSKIILNKKTKVEVSSLPPFSMENLFIEQLNGPIDTLDIYYKNMEDSLKLILNYPEVKHQDTLNLALAKKNAKRKKFAFITLNTVENSIPLFQSLHLSFISWMDTSKTNWQKMKLISKKDSLTDTLAVKGYWTNIHQLKITTPMPEGRSYTLILDTTAFTNINGLYNDSARYFFKPQSKEEFGKVTLKMLLNKKQQVLVQLINEKEQTVKEQIISLSLSSSNAQTLVFTNVPPGVYVTRIVFDENENKKWDSGDLFLKHQAERVIINSKQLKVIADWEMEEEIVVKE